MMTTLERIKELLDKCPAHDGHCTGQRYFLLRAFKVMREIAIKHADAGEFCLSDNQLAEFLDEQFEERMKEPISVKPTK